MDNNSFMWLVLVAIGTIASLFISVGAPIIKLTKTMAEMSTRLGFIEKAYESIKEDLQHQFEGIKESNKESHRQIHTRIDNVEKNVGVLDKRVSLLEKK